MLAEVTKMHRDMIMIGLPNNLHAQPNTFGGKVATWVEKMLRQEEHFQESRK